MILRDSWPARPTATTISRPLSEILRAAASPRPRALIPLRHAARRLPLESLRSRIAKEHRYATRSRHGTSRGSAKRPTSRRKRLPDDSGAVLLTARYKRTLSPSNADKWHFV